VLKKHLRVLVVLRHWFNIRYRPANTLTKTLARYYLAVMVCGFCLLGTVGCSGTPFFKKPPSAMHPMTLQRGINLSHWFAQVYDVGGDFHPSHLKTYVTTQDLALIKSMGFDHVRLPIDPAPMFDEHNPDKLPQRYLKYVDAAINSILSHDLHVIVDLHPTDAFKQRLSQDNQFIESVARFWEAWAHHLSSRFLPQQIALELLNEPMITDPSRWQYLHDTLIQAVRRGAPDHKIIASGGNWSGVDDLLRVVPVDDPNVIYNFHMYNPILFTHQGATWGWDMCRYVNQVPYPSSPQAIQAILPDIKYQPVHEHLIRYGQDQWNAQKIAQLVSPVAQWAQRYGKKVTCNEFGVYIPNCPKPSRLRWLTDTRQTLEQFNIGWSMWDYSGGFSLVSKHDGRPRPDIKVLMALGMYPSITLAPPRTAESQEEPGKQSGGQSGGGIRTNQSDDHWTFLISGL